MIKEAFKYLVGLGQKEVIIEEHGAKYTTDRLYRLEAPMPNSLETNTLKSIADYIRDNVDFNDKPEFIINVRSHSNVELLLPLNDDCNRVMLINCKAPQRDNLNFGRFMDVTQFNIMLQSSFVDIPGDINHKEVLLAIVGNIGDGVVKNFGDDGVSQKTTIKTGVENLSECKVPNPVILAPYRTFSEVDQPDSKFIFRLESGRGDSPTAALFEADGGAWKIEAKDNIIDYFKEAFAGMSNVHILG
jgi:hypothetical protein